MSKKSIYEILHESDKLAAECRQLLHDQTAPPTLSNDQALPQQPSPPIPPNDMLKVQEDDSHRPSKRKRPSDEAGPSYQPPNNADKQPDKNTSPWRSCSRRITHQQQQEEPEVVIIESSDDEDTRKPTNNTRDRTKLPREEELEEIILLEDDDEDKPAKKKKHSSSQADANGKDKTWVFGNGVPRFVQAGSAQNREVARDIRRKFNLPSTTARVPWKRELKQSAKDILNQMTYKPPAEVSKQKEAWKNAAMAWRNKNMPSGPEMNARKAEADRKLAERTFRAPRQRSSYGQQTPTMAQYATGKRGGGGGREYSLRKNSATRQQPAPDASEADKRTFYRNRNQAKLTRGMSFLQVLRAFDVPCEASKLKDGWRTAVKMYHPDSNSSLRKWTSKEEHLECEEIMKIINRAYDDASDT